MQVLTFQRNFFDHTWRSFLVSESSAKPRSLEEDESCETTLSHTQGPSDRGNQANWGIPRIVKNDIGPCSHPAVDFQLNFGNRPKMVRSPVGLLQWGTQSCQATTLKWVKIRADFESICYQIHNWLARRLLLVCTGQESGPLPPPVQSSEALFPRWLRSIPGTDARGRSAPWAAGKFLARSGCEWSKPTCWQRRCFSWRHWWVLQCGWTAQRSLGWTLLEREEEDEETQREELLQATFIPLLT